MNDLLNLAVNVRSVANMAMSIVIATGAQFGTAQFAVGPATLLEAGEQGAVVPADARTVRIVEAANTFMSTLSSEQLRQVLFSFNDREQRERWSDQPESQFQRRGLRWANMTPMQRKSLRNLLGAMLSDKGLRMVELQMAGDELSKPASLIDALLDRVWTTSKRGRDWYSVAILGVPSANAPWMLQFGGHHLAINATVVGPHVTLAPMLTGGSPVRFTHDGESVNLMRAEFDIALKLYRSLNASQGSVASLGRRRPEDLTFGPGRDAAPSAPSGIAGRDLNPQQQSMLLALVRSRLDLINDDYLEHRLQQARAELKDTYFAWYGRESGEDAFYWRIQGSSLKLEFSAQEPGYTPDHFHAIYRDTRNDYGSAWRPR